LFGWQNSATYGTVISYNLYWLVVITGFLALRYNEKNGHWPLMKAKVTPPLKATNSSSESLASPVEEIPVAEATVSKV
jgi:high-affinity iron transporter